MKVCLAKVAIGEVQKTHVAAAEWSLLPFSLCYASAGQTEGPKDDDGEFVYGGDVSESGLPFLPRPADDRPSADSTMVVAMGQSQLKAVGRTTGGATVARRCSKQSTNTHKSCGHKMWSVDDTTIAEQ